VHGINELELTGDIKMPMTEHLEMHMLQGPFSNEVIEWIERHRSLAEGEYRQKTTNVLNGGGLYCAVTGTTCTR
jgi:hypothetical protein